MKGSKRIAVLGFMTTLALILSYVESLIPFLPGIPGVKLGLANLVMVYVLYRFSGKDALLVSVVRILASGFLFGNLMSISFSLAGSILSLLIMTLCKRRKLFSVMGVSIAGGCMHNIGQLLVAFFAVNTPGLFYYIPVLLVSGLVTGLLIGIGGNIMLKRLPDLI